METKPKWNHGLKKQNQKTQKTKSKIFVEVQVTGAIQPKQYLASFQLTSLS